MHERKSFHSLFPARHRSGCKNWLLSHHREMFLHSRNHSHALLLRADTSSTDLRELLRLNDQKCNYFRSLFMLQLVCLNLKLLTRVSRFSFNWFYCNMNERKVCSLIENYILGHAWRAIGLECAWLRIGNQFKALGINLRINVMIWELFLLPAILWISNYSQQNNSNQTLGKSLPTIFGFPFEALKSDWRLHCIIFEELHSWSKSWGSHFGWSHEHFKFAKNIEKKKLINCL